MSCEYCTQKVVDGEKTDNCGTFFYSEVTDWVATAIRIEPWVDDDGRNWTVLVDNGIIGMPSSRGRSVAVATMPAPPFCPWCGDRLKED